VTQVGVKYWPFGRSAYPLVPSIAGSRLRPPLAFMTSSPCGSGALRRSGGRRRSAERALRSRRRTPSTPAKSSRSQYAINADVIAAGRLPENPPVVTSKANPHYQKRFDTLHGFAVAGDWDAVREYKVTGSNSYSKMVERYRQNLLALHAASEAAQ